jgi:HEAT repeat protein
MQLLTHIHTWIQQRRLRAAVRQQLRSHLREEQAEALSLLVSLHDVSELRHALGHCDPWVRCEAIKSLVRLGAPHTARWLVRTLTDPKRSVAHTAAECLGRMDAKTRQILPALRQCVASEDWLIRYHGTVGLDRHRGKSPAVDRLLTELTHDDHPWVRNSAIQALRRVPHVPCISEARNE